MAKKTNVTKTNEKDPKVAKVNSVEVPITIGFDQTKVIGFAKVMIGDHLTMLPNMVLAPSYEVREVEFNEEGEAIKRELHLIELSMITPQVASPTQIKKAE